MTTKIWDDTIIIRKQIQQNVKKGTHVFQIKSSQIKNNVFVPRYYWISKLKKIEREAKKQKIKMIPLSELIDTNIVQSWPGDGSPESVFKGKGDISYVRVADIVNWDVYKNPTAMIPKSEYDRVKSKNLQLQENDILFVRRGSYRIGTVALVTKQDIDVLLTRELTVFRISKKNNPYDIDPYYLMFLLSHDLVQRQLGNYVFMDTTLPNIHDRFRELKMPIHTDKKKLNNIKIQLAKIFKLKKRTSIKILKLGNEYGKLTT